MRKPTFCICENKDADQLRGNSEADQRLCFRYTDSTIPRLSKSDFQASSHLLYLYSLFCVGPGRKPECWFSHDAAQISFANRSPTVRGCSCHLVKSGSPWEIQCSYTRHSWGTPDGTETGSEAWPFNTTF